MTVCHLRINSVFHHWIDFCHYSFETSFIQRRESDAVLCTISYQNIVQGESHPGGVPAILVRDVNIPPHYVSKIIIGFANFEVDFPKIFVRMISGVKPSGLSMYCKIGRTCVSKIIGSARDIYELRTNEWWTINVCISSWLYSAPNALTIFRITSGKAEGPLQRRMNRL